MPVELPEESASDPTQQPMKALWQGKMLNHLQRSKWKAYKNCKSFSWQYARQKTIVSPHIISSDDLGLTDHHLTSLSSSWHLSSAHHSSSGGTKWDSLMTTPVQPPITTFPPSPTICVTDCYTDR